MNNGDKPLSFVRRSLWALARSETGKHAYNYQAIVRINGKLGVVALRHRYKEVTQRQEMLRTNFSAVKGIPISHVVSESAAHLQFADIGSIFEYKRQFVGVG